jgi:hypothetical protein
LQSQSWDQATRIALPKFQKFQCTSHIAYNGPSVLNAGDLAAFLPTVLLQQMHYGDPIIRKTVALVLSLVSTSNPVFHILGTLSKYSHDNDDLAIALNAIFAMGLDLASTNDAQLVQMPRQLAGYY